MRCPTCIFAAVLVAACHVPADDGIAARLGSSDRRVARQALEAATSRGSDVIPELRAILHGDDRLAAQYAALALGRINAPGADHALLKCLSTRRGREDAHLIQFASEALAARGAEALPVLRRALALDRPPALADEMKMHYYVFEWLGALPTDLADEILVALAARSGGGAQSWIGIYFIDQGPRGMRLWADNFLRDEPIPSLDEADAAWRLPIGEWGHPSDDALRVLAHGSLESPLHPDAYTIEMKEGQHDYLLDLAWEYARSDAAEQRLWGLSHLLRLAPDRFSSDPAGRMDVIRAILTDSHWRIPLLLERHGSLDLRGEEILDLSDELRACLEHESEAVAALAAATLLQIGDPPAVEFTKRNLADGCPRTVNALAWAIEWAIEWAGSDGLTAVQRMTLLEPLLERVRADCTNRLMRALAYMPADAWRRIAELLDSGEAELRSEAAWVLGHIGSEEALPALEQALGDPFPDVRRAALVALARIGSREIEVHLEPFLASDHEEDRQAAFRAAYVANDAALMARVFRRIPADCSVSHYDGLTSYHWPPNLPEEARNLSLVQRAEMEFGGGIRIQSPPLLLEVAQQVMSDETLSGIARWNAASLIIWNMWEGQDARSFEYDPGRTEEFAALVNDDLWPAVEIALRHPELYDGNQSHLRWAVEHVRRKSALPLLQRWAQYQSGWMDPLAVQALAHIEPEGGAWLVEEIRQADEATALNISRTLARVGLGGAVEPIAERARRGERQDWLRVLRDLHEDGADEVVREVLSDVPRSDFTALDLRMLMRVDPDEAREVARWALTQRTDWRLRGVAISAISRDEDARSRRLLLQIVHDEGEWHRHRYRALRAIEHHDPDRARAIAQRWTRDHRMVMRGHGRSLLRGEERYYL